jgi:hypothetical protein
MRNTHDHQPGEAPDQTPSPVAEHSEIPARTIGESLVRDSLLEIENRMTADHHLGQPEHPDEHRE